MKNLFLSAAIVLGSLTSFASTSPIKDTTVKVVSVGDELKKAYPNAVISKAYKNEKSEYKLEVTVGDKTGNLFANADGTWIKK